MPQALQVVTTTADQAEAERIARTLVERRLAACVQVSGPIISWYRWQGAVETSTEWRCTVKTTAAAYAEVEQAIRELHSYDQPQIIALPIVAGSQGYLGWLDEQVGGDSPSAR